MRRTGQDLPRQASGAISTPDRPSPNRNPAPTLKLPLVRDKRQERSWLMRTFDFQIGNGTVARDDITSRAVNLPAGFQDPTIRHLASPAVSELVAVDA